MPVSTPSLADMIERARREKWTRLALLGPLSAGEDGWRKRQLRDRGWLEESIVVVTEVNGEPADLVASVAQIRSLKELLIDYPRVGDAGARAIAQHLTALTSLDLTGNGIGDVGARAIAQHLHALTSLDLSSNRIGGAGARAIAQHLHALTSLSLAGNQIGGAGARAIAQHLHALTSLDLSSNGIGNAGAQAVVNRLRHLRLLSLDDNAISALPDAIGQLDDLHTLYIADNDLGTLPRTLLRLRSLQALLVHNNPRLNLPPELAKSESDVARILAWYFGQKRRLNEAKVLMVGQGGVGKTSLVSAVIHGRKADPDERKTEKIRIDTWAISSRHANETIRVNVWDFGGQEIMHATHQFFLTKRSVYVLVLDARQGEIEGNIHYWLQTIQSFGGDSPVLVVTNKCDVQPLSLNENGLKKQYAPMEIGFHSVSCATLEGIAGLKEALAATIRGLAHIDDELPATYFDVKVELEKAAGERHYFEMTEYAKLCEERGVPEEPEQRRLLRFLHDLGTVLNFDDPDSPYQVGDTNILNPEWVTEAVYAIINNHSLMQAQGQLDWKRLPDILKDSGRYPRDKQRFIVEMMRKFELCFDFPDRPNTLLIPELLTKNEPDVNWRPAEECLNFEYAYAVLPSGLLPRFIVRMHHALTDKPTYWRSGVVLAIDGCKVLVRGDSRANVVQISVDGRPETRRGALATVRDQLKGIHATIPRLQVEERVPLPDFPSVAVPYGYLLQLEELSRSRPDMDRFIPQGLPMGEAREYSARKLLSGIEVSSGKPTAPSARKRPPDQDRSLDVFISYSTKDARWKDELITMLKPYTRREVMAVWHDHDIKPGDDWRREIDEALARAKVGVLLVSKDFLASDFIMETELPHLMTAAEKRGVKIGWMLISDCTWKHEEFPKFQSLVGSLNKPLDSLRKPQRNTAMKKIAEAIDALVRRARGDAE